MLDGWGNWSGSVVGNILLKGNDDCVFNKCLQFSGGEEHVLYSASKSPQHSKDNVTISLWIKSKNISSQQTIFSRNGPYIIRISGSKMRVCFFTTTNWIFSTGQKTLQSNEWYYITTTYDGAFVKTYVNGVLDINDSRTGNFGSYHDLYFGKPVPVGENFPFNGFLDDVRLYNKALSSSQIKQNYIAGLNSMLSNGNISKQEYNERIGELAYTSSP